MPLTCGDSATSSWQLPTLSLQQIKKTATDCDWSGTGSRFKEESVIKSNGNLARQPSRGFLRCALRSPALSAAVNLLSGWFHCSREPPPGSGKQAAKIQANKVTTALAPGSRPRPARPLNDRLGAQTAGSGRKTPLHSGRGEPKATDVSGAPAA